jgi:hypothetical protein
LADRHFAGKILADLSKASSISITDVCDKAMRLSFDQQSMSFDEQLMPFDQQLMPFNQ